MSNSMPIVLKLQADATNPDVPVSNLLRVAKIVATKLNLHDALVWIDRELNGYMGLKADDLPPYRRLSGTPKGWNPHRGWQPIFFEDPEEERLFSQAPIGQALGAIEENLRDRRDGRFAFPYSPETKALLMKSIDFPTEVLIHLSYGQFYNIVDAVRNLVLNWSLELEKAGILGADIAFSAEEKKEAAPITQQFFAQNIGVVGNVTDQAQVANEQTATMNFSLDVAQVRDFAAQIREALALLPDDERARVEPALTDLEGELANDVPNQSRLRELLSSIRSVCEGAAGNLTAQGIGGIISNLISGV